MLVPTLCRTIKQTSKPRPHHVNISIFFQPQAFNNQLSFQPCFCYKTENSISSLNSVFSCHNAVLIGDKFPTICRCWRVEWSLDIVKPLDIINNAVLFQLITTRYSSAVQLLIIRSMFQICISLLPCLMAENWRH